MVIPGDPTPAPGGRQQPTSQGLIDVDNFDDDSESASDSQDEGASLPTTKTSARGSSGHNLSSNRHTNEGDRVTGQRPTPDGAPPSRMSKPGVDGRSGQESLNKNAASEASRRTGGEHHEPPRVEARRQGNEAHTGDKRPHRPSDARRRDSRDERGPSYAARADGDTDLSRRQRPPEEARSSPRPREEKAVERKEDPEGRRGAGGPENRQHGSSTTRSNSSVVVTNPLHPKYGPTGGPENRQHDSSATRPYPVVASNPPRPNSGPQREPKSSPSEGTPGGVSKGQGEPASQRHSTPYSQGPPGGYPNPNDGSGNMAPQDHPGLDAAAGVQTPPYPQPPGPDTDATLDGERHQRRQENHQGGTGRALLTKTWNLLGGGGSSAPTECKCKEHEHTISTMEGRAHYQHQQIQKLNHRNSDQAHRLQSADKEILHLTEKLQFMTNELNNVHRELVDSKALSDTRGKELIGSQAFLSKADSISVSELVDLTRTLNNEIFQTAASISESFKHEVYMEEEDVKKESYLHLRAIIGDPITWFITHSQNKLEVNPLLVQITLQALISAYCHSKMSKWYHGSGETNDLIEAVYETIRQTENQAVSGRWRALTRARLRPDTDLWIKDFLDEFEVMLRVAEWDLADPELKDALTQRLLPIFAAASKLCIALGEQFTSADIEVSLAQSQAAFNARDFEDEWGDARSQSSSQARVGGTTGVGLKRRVVHGGADEIFSYETVLPPKVVLIPSLEEIVAPPPPRPKRKKVSAGDGAGAPGS